MEEAFFTILRGAGIAAAKISPVELPQGIGAFSQAVTYTRLGGFREHAMNGPTGLVESRVRIDCRGADASNISAYDNAKSLARAVRDVILPAGGFKATVDGVEIQGIFLHGENDAREDRVSGVGSVILIALDCTIWHKE